MTVAVAAFAALYHLRSALPNGNEGVTHLYVLPIALVAVEFGAIAGIAAALAALGLFGLWDATSPDVTVPALGYVTRSLAFVTFAGVLGRFASDRRSLEERLRTLADHDALTGLLNRRRLEDEANRYLRRARHGGDGGAMLFIDLDGFKAINDTFGHRSGDEVLRRMGAVLGSEVRPGDVSARFGGDEFVVLLPGATRTEAVASAERLAEGLERAGRAALDGDDPVRVSVGIAVFAAVNSTVDAEELIALADSAMYDAKRRGGGISAAAAGAPAARAEPMAEA